MTEKMELLFICEDCAHSFNVKIRDEGNYDDIVCPKCGSEFVNNDIDRSVMQTLGIPDPGHCSPDACKSCTFACDKHDFGVDEEE